MTLHGLVGGVAAILAFVLGYTPAETQITVYALVGAVAGLIFAGANRWAREGIAAAAIGLVAGVMVNQVIPDLLAIAPSTTPLERVLLDAIPLILQAAFIWAPVSTLIEELRGNGPF